VWLLINCDLYRLCVVLVLYSTALSSADSPRALTATGAFPRTEHPRPPRAPRVSPVVSGRWSGFCLRRLDGQLHVSFSLFFKDAVSSSKFCVCYRLHLSLTHEIPWRIDQVRPYHGVKQLYIDVFFTVSIALQIICFNRK